MNNAPGVTAACPELGAQINGVSADMKLTVSRATGAVTLHRLCRHIISGMCPINNPAVTPTTSTIDVTGTTTCQ